MVIVAILAMALLGGCTPTVEHTAPQLDPILKGLAECPRLPQVNPIPNQLKLIIDGESVDADAAGKRLLLDYSRCYSAGAHGGAN